ncbi:glucose transporter, lmgt3 [Leishmania infantum JPCM5]|nr:glucose transporter, lmgt3 [Leishmania infantum JPCM5]CBZ09047.1 glucose transporter, lmgt3 [Leishmania infantum JPCM5]|eukprot:XP_003392839.1 glucose transporter, lmgt3 [Leishmania infantum JPCM5]
MCHVSTSENEFWVLIVGRFAIGLFLGVIGVACPVYTDQNAHPKWKRTIGVMFQVFTTLGIFVAAAVGLALGQSIWFDRDKDQMVMARMQGLCAFSTLFSLLTILLGIVMSESRAKFGGDDEEGGIELDPNEYGYVEMIPRLLMGAVMAGTLQLTGINAVMSYAPTIMGSLGLAPLVGNFVVMLWNFVTTLASIPLSYVFTMRQLFLFGSLFTSSMCLFMCGIPVYPGVSKKTEVKNGVAITGILLFILGFEVCVGPCYYVLTQDMFPLSFRPRGASFTQVTQFIFNLIINVCYPIATEHISGGPSGNQDKGQAVAFIFFGCVGIICFIVQVFFLHPWDEKRDGKKRAAAPADGKKELSGEFIAKKDI